MLLQRQVSDAQLISPILNAPDDISLTSENNGLNGEREIEVETETDVTLTFSLPAGSYATAFIRELMKNNDSI